jgi:hypothetical protein
MSKWRRVSRQIRRGRWISPPARQSFTGVRPPTYLLWSEGGVYTVTLHERHKRRIRFVRRNDEEPTGALLRAVSARARLWILVATDRDMHSVRRPRRILAGPPMIPLVWRRYRMRAGTICSHYVHPRSFHQMREAGERDSFSVRRPRRVINVEVTRRKPGLTRTISADDVEDPLGREQYLFSVRRP